jgi:hypothetical protein
MWVERVWIQSKSSTVLFCDVAGVGGGGGCIEGVVAENHASSGAGSVERVGTYGGTGVGDSLTELAWLLAI